MTVRYQLDLHVHSIFSADGISLPEDLIAEAKRKGLHGFAITDHNTCEAVDYMIDRGLMRRDGQPVDGFLIIPGVETTTAEGHLISLGITLPNLKGVPAAEVVERTHDLGGLAIPPHPYDMFRAGIREKILDTLDLDGLEVFNAATTFKRYNRRAFEYAKARKLAMTAGSDAHHASAIGTAYTIVETDDFSVAGVLLQILRGTAWEERYSTPKDFIRKTWNNWLRLKEHRPVARRT